ncbi:uncharacterized protein BKCO1_3000167 [Diplodia corticola]|uniref:DUF803-domain-containing protein n=1 Tax=Diplodia corticola TaxID=236234 RepID=A0A1J9REV2_9PEZI|nr:uncharacterized protein BKCO1_3000167 [Diplodia corticola]OJD39080.1 hypothetical protein BKCO1_3000167 [Diplodia corticola]
MMLPTAAQAPLHDVVANAALAAATHAAAAMSAAAATTPSPYPHPSGNHTLTDHGGAGGDNSEQGDWSSIIGITTAIVGNILISFALNTQKYAHLRLAHEAEERRQRRKRSASGMQTPDEEMAKANAKARKILGFKLGSDDGEGNDDEEDDGEPRETDALLGDGRHSHDVDRAAVGSDEEDAASLEAQAKRLRNPPKKQTSYLQSPYWWIGIVLMIVGEAGNFLAYGFAPASIVSPLGVVALISNCIIAPIMLKEPFRKRDALGVLISIGGAVTVVLSAQDNNPKLGPHEIWELIKTWEFETYFGVTLITICGLMWASTRYGKKSIFIDLGLVGLFGGYTALSTKGVASMLSYTLLHALTFPVTYLMVVILVSTAVMQIKYLNRALQRFDATQVIPTQFVLFTLSVILGSAILYRDFERTNGKGAGEFVGGCLMTFMGVWVITTGRPRDDNDEEEEDEEEEEHAMEQEHAIHLGPEEYGDDEVHYGPSYSNDVSSMAALTPYASAGSHHRRPSVHRLNTPHITLTSEPPSQAVTVSTTPAGLDIGDDDSLTANPWADESLISSLTANRKNNQPPLLHATTSSPILPSEAEALAQRPDSRRRDTSPMASSSSATPAADAERPATPPGPGPTPLRRKSLTTPSPSKKPPPPPSSSSPSSSSKQHQQQQHPPQPSPRIRPAQTEPATPASTSSTLAKTPTSHLKRGSISLVPGPLTSPLSSSLSAVVADSLRKGVEMRSLTGGHGHGHGRPRRNTKDGAEGVAGGGSIGFGGWLTQGASVAGPRDGPSDASAAAVAAAAARRRSRGVSQSEGVGVGSPLAAVVAAGGEGSESGGRARSLSNPFGSLLKKVRSRGDGVAEEEAEAEASASASAEASGADTPVTVVPAEPSSPAPLAAAAAEEETRAEGQGREVGADGDGEQRR